MATFVPASGVGRELARTAEARTMLAQKAARVAAAARANGSSVRRSGDYAKSFSTRLELEARGWVAYVVNTDWKAGFVEFGTRNNPKHRVLGRALDAAR